MGVITIDYDLMAQLANKLYDLRNTVDAASKTDHTFTASDIGPDPGAAAAVSDFYGDWKKAFHRAWNVMTVLGNDFTTAANSFFDGDAATAAGINETSLASDNAKYQADQAAYQAAQKQYQADKKANPKTKEKAPVAPVKQDQWVTMGRNDSEISSKNVYDSSGKVVGVQSTILDHSSGLSYSETTTFTANNGYTTVVHYADGSVMTTAVAAQPDGSATKTETDGTGKVLGTWTGNVNTDQWTQTSGDSGS